jgi:hypothetical protein
MGIDPGMRKPNLMSIPLVISYFDCYASLCNAPVQVVLNDNHPSDICIPPGWYFFSRSLYRNHIVQHSAPRPGANDPSFGEPSGFGG